MNGFGPPVLGGFFCICTITKNKIEREYKNGTQIFAGQTS